MVRTLTIDVFFEFICPWCLIGKRQLENAIQKMQNSDPDIAVHLKWHGVQLLPHLPVDGVPFQAFYEQRLGSSEAVRMRQAQVHQAAQAVHADIDFSKIKTMPNTAKAHHLMQKAVQLSEQTGSTKQVDDLLEYLFSAYFFDSKDLSNLTVLQEIFDSCGFSFTELVQQVDDLNQPFHSSNTGSNGVPYFIFNERLALSGAHSSDVIYQAMLEAVVTQG